MLDGERPLRAFLKPIQSILDAGAATEIVVNGPGKVGIEENGKWRWLAIEEWDRDRLDQIGILAGHHAGVEFDEAHPMLRSSLPDGQRLTMVRDPATAKENMLLAIRLPSTVQPSLDDPDLDSMMDRANRAEPTAARVIDQSVELFKARRWRELFRYAVESGMNILIEGETGSGKSHFAKRCASAIPPDERVITIEDAAAEFGAMHHLRNRADLRFGAAHVSAADAAEISMRLRPDRVIVQEIRGVEGFSYYRILLFGHRGCITTLHAEGGPDNVIEAVATMVKTHEAGRSIPDDKLRRTIYRLTDMIVWTRKERGRFHIPYVWLRHADEVAELNQETQEAAHGK